MKIVKILGLTLIALFTLQACDKDDDNQIIIGSISGLKCQDAEFASRAKAGTSYTSTFKVPYAEGNGVTYTTSSGIASTGVTGLSATLAPGTLAVNGGHLTFNVTGTPAMAGTASFLVNFGGQSCTVSMPVDSASTNP
ncbi:hypothetical protein [Emticicia sp. TH156]|uniref:hypothetical protein n=1 Tax=Emticicia sp. TH156 TaxID=2067454 RepID=UPI000C760416|nr:hypothetical protein [Emticicia sp. TH156]PLK44363.1 hypothetical protein C0V77_11285 [Emticicia sp. TH156]